MPAAVSRRRSDGASLPSPSFDLHHVTLSNGLRVVLAPDRSAPVVGIAVLYDVGIRSEPEGRTGFAHLFEHLMFQGSANLEKLEHFRYVQSVRRHVQRQHPLRLHQLLRGAAVQRPRTRPVPRGRPHALPAHHRGEPRQPDRRGEEGDPGQRAQPALRRVPVDRPAARAVRHLPQLAQRLRRLRGSGKRDGRRRDGLLRPLLRAGQRRARRRGRPRRRRDGRADREAFRRDPQAPKASAAKFRRAAARVRAPRRNHGRARADSRGRDRLSRAGSGSPAGRASCWRTALRGADRR